jgi:glycosyltransferase involved in cell wall biosynthesis
VSGADSRFLVGKKTTADPRVEQLPSSHGLLDRIVRKGAARVGVNDAAIRGTAKAVLNHPWVRQADVLHFHNLHGGYFNYRAIADITQQRPAVWTLHDMWGFTGHCVYSFGCERWRTGCGACPDLTTYPAMRRDFTAGEHKFKLRAYERSRLAVVTLCSWMTSLVGDSILNRFPVHQIPNGLDTDVYSPGDKEACRTALKLPHDRHVILFAAQSLTDPRKGGDIVIAALNKLEPRTRAKTTLLTFGTGGAELGAKVGLPTTDLGFIQGDPLKVVAYSAADLFVFPTRADNLPVVIQESLACGTPVVTCAVGGVPDMVRHLENGWLAAPDDSDSFQAGIDLLLADPVLRTRLGQTARAMATSEYGVALQASRILDLYSTLARGGSA